MAESKCLRASAIVHVGIYVVVLLICSLWVITNPLLPHITQI